jgi:hypothetical protein
MAHADTARPFPREEWDDGSAQRRVSNEREIEAQGGKNREEDAASGTLSKKDPKDQIII